MVAKTRKITASQAFKALRLMGRNKDADAIIVIRGRLDQQGEWEIDLEAAHWFHEAPKEHITPSGLPVGFGPAALADLASVTAGDAAEGKLGRFGAALGKGLLDSLGEKLAGMTGVNESESSE